MRTAAALTLALAATIVGESAFAQNADPPPAGSTAMDARPSLTAVPIREGDALTIDGALTEALWQGLAPASEFRQRDPDNGQLATERTEVRIVYDENRLVLGVICFDSEPDKLFGNQMQRDQPFSADDRFMWALDPFSDQRSGYFFEINPSGAMGDGLIAGAAMGGGGLGGQVNKSWDGIWVARVRRTSEGWTAEIEIPFKTLNFNPAADAWGVNFQRTVRRKNEESLWTGWLRNEGLTRMSNAGQLFGLRDLSQGIGLDVKPYVVGSVANAPGRGAPASQGDGDVGIDFFYNVTPALKATFTVNTDFAETEVDQRQVNLTRFPLFFPEKREFFLAGANYFDFAPTPDTPPFFSRRVGLTAGQPQRILFGAKLLGQAGAFDLGVLHVRTGDNEDEGAPGEDFSVLRVKRRFWSQSSMGLLYTRRAPVDGTLAALDLVEDRHTAAGDVTLATPNFRGRYNLETVGWFAHTTPVAGAGDDSNAYGWRVGFPNDPWSADFSFRAVEGAYDAAVGFTPRRDFRRYNPDVGFNPTLSGHPFIRGLGFRAESEIITNLSNVLITRNHNVTPFEVDFHSGDSIGVSVYNTTEQLETDFEISDGIVLPRSSRFGWTRYQVGARLSSRRAVAGGVEFSDGGFFSGDRRELSVEANVRPRPGINIGVEGEWNDVQLAEGSFSTAVYRVDARTQFSPWISLGNNVQYDSVSRGIGWQLRFRWILKPGDDIFFVFTHNWLDDLETARYRVLDRRAAMKVVRTWRF